MEYDGDGYLIIGYFKIPPLNTFWSETKGLGKLGFRNVPSFLLV